MYVQSSEKEGSQDMGKCGNHWYWSIVKPASARLDVFTSTSARLLKTAMTLVAGDPVTSPGLWGYQAYIWYTDICRKNTHKIKQIFFKRWHAFYILTNWTKVAWSNTNLIYHSKFDFHPHTNVINTLNYLLFSPTWLLPILFYCTLGFFFMI